MLPISISEKRKIEKIIKLSRQKEDLLEAAKLALVELDRIGSDVGFEPDRYQERINALDALSRAVGKAGE
jgi:hypothetical protein